MGLSLSLARRVYIALFAVLVELVAVAASGNQGVTNFVADHMATSPLGDLFLRSLPTFPWRVTTQDRGGATTILVAQYAAIATLLVLTFLLVLLTVRGAATFSGPFFAALSSVVLATLVAQAVRNAVDYDWDGRAHHTGLGRFGYALFLSNDGLTIMWGVMCAVVVAIVVGIVGVVMRRRVPPEPEVAASPTLESAGFGGPDSYNPPTQPWQEPSAPFEPSFAPPAYAAESYAPPSYAPQSYAPESYAPTSTIAGGDGAPADAPAPEAATATTATAASEPVRPPAWVPPPEPHPSFAYPPTYHTEPVVTGASSGSAESPAEVAPVAEAPVDEAEQTALPREPQPDAAPVPGDANPVEAAAIESNPVESDPAEGHAAEAHPAESAETPPSEEVPRSE
jgi:hypothetical protein